MLKIDTNFTLADDIHPQLTSQDLHHLHLRYTTYTSLLKNIDLDNKVFIKQYEYIIKKYIKDYLKLPRLVYSRVPKIVCSLPKHKLYHEISHPYAPNATTILWSLTSWSETNTINITSRTGDSIECNSENTLFLIDHKDIINLPQTINTSNNSSLGLFFISMSLETYRENKLQNLEPIGRLFNFI